MWGSQRSHTAEDTKDTEVEPCCKLMTARSFLFNRRGIFEFALQRAAMKAEGLRGPTHISSILLNCAINVIPLNLLSGGDRGERLRGR